MEKANKETVGPKGRSACSVKQLITADDTDNTRWELSTLHYIHCAQAMGSDLCLEYLSSSVCAVSYNVPCTTNYSSHTELQKKVL